MAIFSPTFEKVIHCDFLRAITKLQKTNISQARLILKSPSSEERGLKLKTLEELYQVERESLYNSFFKQLENLIPSKEERQDFLLRA